MKVAIAGAPESGKLSILEKVAERFGAPEPVEREIGELKVHGTRWSDFEMLGGDKVVTITLMTLHGKVGYNAAEELLVREADGVVFVIDVEPPRLKDAWEALLRVSDNAQRNGYELRSIPLALQYHRADRHPGFEPAKLDEWLGVPTGSVPRYVTSSSSPDMEGMAFDSVMAQIEKRLGEIGAAA
ncbi:MAG: GTPase domain-containing protein [Verrucomicrobiota bacterium]